jgi:hypothetical protein
MALTHTPKAVSSILGHWQALELSNLSLVCFGKKTRMPFASLEDTLREEESRRRRFARLQQVDFLIHCRLSTTPVTWCGTCEGWCVCGFDFVLLMIAQR